MCHASVSSASSPQSATTCCRKLLHTDAWPQNTAHGQTKNRKYDNKQNRMIRKTHVNAKIVALPQPNQPKAKALRAHSVQEGMTKAENPNLITSNEPIHVYSLKRAMLRLCPWVVLWGKLAAKTNTPTCCGTFQGSPSRPTTSFPTHLVTTSVKAFRHPHQRLLDMYC